MLQPIFSLAATGSFCSLIASSLWTTPTASKLYFSYIFDMSMSWTYLALLMSSLFLLGCGPAEDVPQDLTVDGPAIHDFGVCRQGDILNHEFPLFNYSNQTIDIVELRSSCSCMVPGGEDGFKAEQIPPHGKVMLPVRFAIGGSQGTAAARLLVFYQSEDSKDREHLDLRVQATIQPDYLIEPRTVDFGEIDSLVQREVVRTVQVTPVAAKNLVVHSAISTNDLIATRIIPSNQGDSGYSIEVAIDASKLTNEEKLESSLVVETNSKRLPKALVSLRGKHRTPASINPEVVIVESDEQGEVSKNVSIQTGLPSQILSAQCTASKSMRIEFDGNLVSKEHRIQLTVLSSEFGHIECNVEFEVIFALNDSTSTRKTLRVPVYRFVPQDHEGVRS